MNIAANSNHTTIKFLPCVNVYVAYKVAINTISKLHNV
jgi:hypothetical protein